MHHLDARPAPVRPARHGQAPVWDDRAGELLWVDVAGEIRWAQVDPAGGVVDLAMRQTGDPVAAVREGRLDAVVRLESGSADTGLGSTTAEVLFDASRDRSRR